jgi:hypothetical protein
MESKAVEVSVMEAMAVGMPRRFEISEAKPSFEAALELNPTSADVRGVSAIACCSETCLRSC